MTFGEKVKAVRLKLHMSQETIARELNVSFSTVNRWESGRCQPNFAALADFDKLCKTNKIVFDDKGKE